MILDSALKSIRVVLGEVITTSNCDCTASYADQTGAGFLPGANDTVTNGTTPVTLVAAPGGGAQRSVQEITVHNNDTVPHTVILQYDDNGTIRIFRDATVPAGGDFAYSPTVSPGSVAGTVPAPTAGTALDLIRINAAGSAYEVQTPNQVLNDIGAGSYSDVGRNLFHNGLFRVQQRGAGPFTSNTYTADRWLLALSVSTASVTIFALSDADRAAIGDEAATFGLQNVVGGTSGAGDFVEMIQRIESVNRTSNKTVIVSFWAKANTGTPKLGFSMQQSFGSGGSPSAGVTGIGSQPITLSTTWTRYSVAIAIPSVAGKTFGTTPNTDFLAVNFCQSSGATNNSILGSPGVQSYTLQLWGMQFEVVPSVSTIPTPLEKPDPRYDLANCQRFYQVGGATFGSTGTTSGTLFGYVPLPVSMRAAPSVVGTNSGSANVTSPNVVSSSTNTTGAVVATGTCTASGVYLLNLTFTASADL
jgi:hypothetical protein